MRTKPEKLPHASSNDGTWPADIAHCFPDPLVIIDLQSRIIASNSAFSCLVAIDGGELKGKILGSSDINLIGWDTWAIVKRVQYGNTDAAHAMSFPEITLQHRSRGLIYFEVSGRELRSGNGSNYLLCLRDISHRKNIEIELRLNKLEAEASSAAKSESLAMVAHEIRTPLAGVRGLLRLMEAESNRGIRTGYLKSAQRCCEVLNKIVGDVLDHSKMDAGKFEIESRRFSIDDVITTAESFWRPQIEDRGLAFRVVRLGDAPRLRGDDVRICQILYNYLSNALKNSVSGAIELVVDARPIDNAVRLDCQVRDTGNGIPAEEQHKIFQPFEQCRGEQSIRVNGTGLGLAICRKLAEVMGGSVGFESKFGVGSTFRLILDVQKDQTESKSEPVNQKRDGDQVPRALIVDDQPVNQLITKLALQCAGFETMIATTGEAAIKALQEFTFDAVFMDVVMPGMGGKAATEFIRSISEPWSSVPIFGLTADITAEKRHELLSAGMQEVFLKPIDPQCVERLLSGIRGNVL